MDDPIIDRFAMAVAANRASFDELWLEPARFRGWLKDVLPSAPSHGEHIWLLSTTDVALDIQRLRASRSRPDSATFRGWTTHLVGAGLSAQDAAWAVRAWLTALGSGAGGEVQEGRALPLFLVLLFPHFDVSSIVNLVDELTRRSRDLVRPHADQLLLGAVALRANGSVRVLHALAEGRSCEVADDGSAQIGRLYDLTTRARQIANELDDQMRSVRAEGHRPAQPHVLVVCPDTDSTLVALSSALESTLAGLMEQPRVLSGYVATSADQAELADSVWHEQLAVLVSELADAPTLAPQAVQMSELVDIIAGDLGHGRSVLPMYVCCDVSVSMSRHGRLTALNTMLEQLRDAIVLDPDVADKVRLSVVDFSEDSRVVLPLCELDSFVTMPVLAHRAETSYIAAFQTLASSIAADVPALAKAGYAVHRPAVFFLSDGAPSDPEWHWKKALRELENHEYRPQVVAFGVGEADPRSLARIGTLACYMAQRPEDAALAIREFGQLLIQSFIASGTTGRFVVPDSVAQHLKQTQLLESF